MPPRFARLRPGVFFGRAMRQCAATFPFSILGGCLDSHAHAPCGDLIFPLTIRNGRVLTLLNYGHAAGPVEHGAAV